MMTVSRSRTVLAVILAALLLLASACSDQGTDAQESAPAGPTTTEGKPIKIGFIVKQPEESWFQKEWKFAQKCADEYGFELVKIGARDGEKVLSAIDNLAAQQAQGFVICTPDVRLGPAIMAKAKANGLKVYAVDDQFLGSDGEFMDMHYMGISAREIGRTVGRALYEEFKRRDWPLEGTAACALTHDELNTVKERTDGATEALVEAGFPSDRIHRGALKTLDVPGAMDAANVVLTQHPDVKRWLVFSVNDEGVLGAVRALEGSGFDADSIIAIGIGGETARVEFEKPRPTGLFATCLISSFHHGYEATEYMFKWIRDGEEPPKDIRTSGIIITRDNYQQVMREQGLLD